MAYSVNTRTNSPANDLRDALKKAEERLVKPTADEVESTLQLLDQIDQLFDKLDASDLDLRPEEVRWESIHNRLYSKPSLIVSPARSKGGLAKLRANNPPAESFWWQLDDLARGRRNKTLRSLFVTIGSIIGVLLVAYFVINYFFPPSPEALVILESTNSIEPDILEQNWEAARQKIEAGTAAAPNEPELWVWHTVLSEQMEDDATATQSLGKARELAADEIRLLVTLSNTRLQVGNIDGTEAAAQQVLALDANNALGTFVLANVAEARGDVRQAVDLFEKTSELAADSDAQLSVISRMRMGTLMQTLPALPGSASTNTEQSEQ